MKRVGKYFILMTLLQVVFGTYSAKAAGFPVLSMDHFVMYVASFIQKMEKVSAYEKEIETTRETIKSLGSLNVNAAENMLKNEISDAKDFADTVHFGDVASFSQGYNSDAFEKAQNELSSSQTSEVMEERSKKKDKDEQKGGK